MVSMKQVRGDSAGQGNRRCLCPFIAIADTNTQDREEQRISSIYHSSGETKQNSTDTERLFQTICDTYTC